MMNEKGNLIMKKSVKKQIVATIYNRPVQTKAEARAESEKAIAAFLRAGGVIQVDERKRRAPKAKMASKSSRGFVSGTSGFATGMPRKTTFSLV
jgi:hypothetical protein